jgi:enoyl-CoA hydratase
MTELTIEQTEGTVLLTLQRPDALNSLTPTLIDQFESGLREAGRDRSVRAVIITGAGRAFCAGIDVKSVARRDAEAIAASALDPLVAQFENLHHRLSDIVRTIHALPIPVISAVNGHAIGAGFAIAAASDLRVAGEAAAFADGFVKRGISGCEMGLSYFLPKIVGPACAFEWMLTGRTVRAVEAERSGLVSRVVASDDLLDAARELAAMVAGNSPTGVSMTKDVMWANLHAASLDHALALESRTQTLVRNTADAREARAAFLEKREPSFAQPDEPRRVR